MHFWSSSLRKLNSSEQLPSNIAAIEPVEPRAYFSVSFAAPKPLAGALNGATLADVVAGDFGTGSTDVAALVAGNGNAAGNVQVFVNNGTANFKLSQTLVTGSGSGWLQAVDLFKTGTLDLIVSNAGDGTLDIFSGNGDGTFATTPVVVTFGPQETFSGKSVFDDPFRVAALQGESLPNSIVVADQYGADVVVLQLDDARQLNVVQTIPIQLGDFVLSDATGDGLPDIVQSTASDIGVLPNQGGGFATAITASFSLNLPAGYAAGPTALTAGDFNGDGLTDLAVTAQPNQSLLDADPTTPGKISVVLALDTGGFAPAVLSNDPAAAVTATSADFDADGKVDLLTLSNSSGDVLLGNGDGTFADQKLALKTGSSEQAAAGYFNGAAVDFITTNRKSALAIYSNKTKSGPTASAELSPAISKTTLGVKLVATPNTHGTVAVALTNTDTNISSGPVTTAVYLALNGLFDDSSVKIGSVDRKLVINPGKTRLVNVPVKLPAGLGGAYTLISVVTNAGGTVANQSGSTVEIDPPVVSFSATFSKITLPAGVVGGQRTTAYSLLDLSNTGNVPSRTSANLSLYLSPTGSVDGAILIRTLPLNLMIKPGASKVVRAPLKALPVTPAGTYFLVASLVDATSTLATVVSTDTFSLTG